MDDKDIKIQYKIISEIIPYKNNPRKNDLAVNAVCESIKIAGFINPIVIDKNNEIIAGHTRLKAAKKLGLKKIPVILKDDLTDEQIKIYRIADNKTSEFASWNNDLLSIELSDIKDFDMSVFDIIDIDGVFLQLNDSQIKISNDMFEQLLQKMIVFQKPLDITVKFDSNFNGGFGGYLAGSFSGNKPVMKINIASLISLVNDPQISNDDSRRAELYKYFLSETLIHELLHILQEALGREFSEDDIEDVLSKVRNENLE